MRKLHEINSDLMTVLEGYLEEEDGNQLDIHSLEIEAVEKVKACLHVCNSFRSEIIDAETTLETVKSYIAKRKKAIERIESEVLLAMELAGIQKIDDPDMKVTIPKPSMKASILDENLIPEQFIRIIPEQKKPDLTGITKALKNGESFEWAKLVPSKVSVRYKKTKKGEN